MALKVTRGLFLLIIGTSLGVFTGIGIRLLERYLAAEIVDVLQDEVMASCPCRLEYDSIKLSLLTMRARCRNVRMVSEGKTVLKFDAIDVDASLKNILNHEILLTRLTLANGLARGVSEDSPTFKFIDHLSTPLPPEQANPDRLRAKLLTLEIKNSRFVEELGNYRLIGRNLEMVMRRNKNDFFDLLPIIGQLELVSDDPSISEALRDIKLGRVSGEMTIEDSEIFYRGFKDALKSSLIHLEGKSETSKGNLLQGTANGELELTDIPGLPLTSGKVALAGVLTGTLGRPKVPANISLRDGNSIVIGDGATPYLIFTDLAGKIEVNGAERPPSLLIHEMIARGEQKSAEIEKPVYIGDSAFRGVIRLSTAELPVNALAKVRDLEARIELSGDAANPVYQIDGSGTLVLGERVPVEGVQFKILTRGDALDFDAWRRSTHGFGDEELLAHGTVNRFAESDRSGENIRISFKNLNLGNRSVESYAALLDGSLDISGPLRSDQVNARGILLLTAATRSARLPLTLDMSVDKGVLEARAASDDKSLQANLILPFDGKTKGKLTASTNKFAIERIVPALSCVTHSASLDYLFSPGEMVSGNGAVNLESLSVGCAPYGLTMVKPTTLPIVRGALSLAPLKLENSPSNIEFKGGISLEAGYQLDAKSHLSLESLLGLVRSIDDIEGDLSTEVSLRGALAQPAISGKVTLRDSLFSIESVDIFGSHINGSLKVDNNRMSFDGFSGNLNGGTFSIDGSLNPFDRNQSDFVFELKNILVEPSEGVSAIWSGTFRIGRTDEALSLLHGTVEIHSAEIRRQLDIVTIIKSIRDLISTKVARQQSFSKVPLAALDLTVNIPGNFLVLSNWASAELEGKLHVRGDPNNPSIEGEIETISGWFGFKNRQFQISSGRLIFSPLSTTPELDLLSETLVRSHFGDNVYMILEVKGPADNPRVKLSSDSGLSERDLLNLLTTGQSPSQQGIFASRGYGFSLEDRPLFDSTKPFSISNFLRDLTRIDVLSIEPTFNARTGAVEPTFIAQRKLTEDFSLFAQNSFGSGSNDSEAGASLQLAPSLALIGGVESSSARQYNALAVDLSYTILAAQKPFVNFTFKGNRAFNEIEILRTIRLTQISRVRPKDLPRLEQQLRSMYERAGYFSALVSLLCEEKDGFCRVISGEIGEGERTEIEKVEVRGDTLPPFVALTSLENSLHGSIASQEVADETQRSLIHQLRSEGYIGARIAVAFEPVVGSSNRVAMVISANVGRPVTFIFRGNKVFGAEELLDTINLFGRKQPFGSNTISILVDNIERKYREEGYLFASIIFKKDIDAVHDRILYTIDIQEESYAPISSVEFRGLSVLSEIELRQLLHKESPTLVERVFSPAVALQEELENNADVIKGIYVSQGYPATKVSAAMKPNAKTGGIDIIYSVVEGRAEKRSWLRFEGVENLLDVPPLPIEPYTIPEANKIILGVLEKAHDNGYLFPAFVSRWSTKEGDPVVLSFNLGEKTLIADIEIEGLSTIQELVVRKALLVQSGDSWSVAKIDESRRALLHLGLFAHVETQPADGELDSAREALLIRVSERPLTTVGAGGGANSAFGLHVFGEAIDRSLFGDGRLLSLRFDTYYSQATAEITQGTANLRYLDPSFLTEDYTFTEDLRYQRLQRATQEFDLNRVSLSSSLQRAFSEWPTISFAHTVLSEELNNVPSDSIVGKFDTGTVRLGFLSGSASYDRRDNPFNPTRGYALNADFRLSARPFGSEAEYSSLDSGASTIIPLDLLSPRFSFALHARAASSWTYRGTDEVPISQRFYLGGRRTVRGFRENSLGPRGVNGNIIGGDMLFLGSSEFQYMLYDLFSLHLFFDTGNVYLRDQDPSLASVRKSTGVGFRYRSPIGPIGFDIGHPLDEQSGEPSVRVHFSVGSNF